VIAFRTLIEHGVRISAGPDIRLVSRRQCGHAMEMGAGLSYTGISSARHKAELHHHLRGVGVGVELGDLPIFDAQKIGPLTRNLAAGRW
jgi:hypothetical protein